ncbi:glycosyltransferase [Rubellimicrobium arenae]|uniref:glycosyltransferase n=1 Tax=Rubellimicrobium arenae TaxID=2817372 RepID=UPI001FEFC8EC|nr:glycosyltransferase [Rubellimicrobium arenae]
MSEQTAPDPQRRIRVLHVTPTYYPAVAFGGPIFSTKALCDGAARDPGFEVRVLTTDSAAPGRSDALPLTENPAWFPAGYEVRYCRRRFMTSGSPELLRRLPGLIRWADVVHVTAAYSFPTIPALLLCRLLGKPVVWSPRGSLQATAQWSGAPRRRMKELYESVCNAVRPRRTILHATAEMERETSRGRLGDIESVVIPNGIELPGELPDRTWRPGGRLRLMFMSRLHEKKGLDVLIRVMARLPAQVTLDIYGDGEADHVAGFRSLVAELGLTDRVLFRGQIGAQEKLRAFAEADLFCLPTRSENFGIVVGEALAHGVPVITTTAAPWDGLETEGCGLWTEQGEDALEAAILSLNNADLAALGERGRQWMERDFTPVSVSLRMRDVYRRLVGGRPAVTGGRPHATETAPAGPAPRTASLQREGHAQ